MEDKIKKYFDNLEVPYNAEHWNLMEQRMAIEELSDFTNKEDEVFDDFVKKELIFEEPAYNHLHWELMAEKLEERTFRGVLYRYKIREISLMLLFIFTVWFAILTHQEINQVASVEPANIPGQGSTVTVKAKNTSIHLHKSSMASVVSNHKRSNQDHLTFLPINNAPVASELKRGLDGIGSYSTVLKFNSNINNDQSILTYSTRNLHSKELASDVLNLEKHIQYAKPVSNVRIGIYAASGIESIAQEEISGAIKEANLAFGYGGGVSLGLKFKDMEFETGASINALVPMHISDDALATKSSARNSATIADEPANKFLKLPFALKYLFDNKGSWKFYALGGGNVHIDINSHEWQQRSNNYAFGARTSNAETSLASNQQALGATFFDRFYYSASIGFGVERQISEKISLFIQPEYYHQLYKPTISLGTGQTNTFALSFGLKSTL